MKDLPVVIEDGQEIELEGWIIHKRISGKLAFLDLRVGPGVVQLVASKKELPAEAWQNIKKVTLESSVKIGGIGKVDSRAPTGAEIHLKDFEIIHLSEEFPITPKEHGIAFLMEHRHLWLRSRKQRAYLVIRNELEQSIHDFFYKNGFIRIDSPILTPAACEGTSTLFETDYFGEKAYLSQSGQLYLEPAAAAFRKVYCFGPTFRAEKSKTRRHLMEFWMVEPEVAFMKFEELIKLAEEFLSYIIQRVLEKAAIALEVIERDTTILEKTTPPFPRITYTEAIETLKNKGFPIEWGDDIGGDEETALSQETDKPLIITHYPKKVKAFYMQPNPDNPEEVLAMDVIAPEGYGEIIGGSERINDLDLLKKRIEEENLPREAFEWYLDIRKFGSFPHSGFGLGIERTVAWITGVKHVRETIPYPRMLYKIYP